MSRSPRQHLDGYPLHIVQRGHNRQRCFVDEADCAVYLRLLADALGATHCTLHAYVLMSNHVHLLLTPRSAALIPRLLMSLGRRYVPYFNRRYNRTGTLWESRYRSSLVTSDYYLLACHRYIEMNPVRAGLPRIRQIIDGRAMGKMRWGEMMRSSRRTPFIWHSARTPRGAAPPIACSSTLRRDQKPSKRSETL